MISKNGRVFKKAESKKGKTMEYKFEGKLCLRP